MENQHLGFNETTKFLRVISLGKTTNLSFCLFDVVLWENETLRRLNGALLRCGKPAARVSGIFLLKCKKYTIHLIPIIQLIPIFLKFQKYFIQFIQFIPILFLLKCQKYSIQLFPTTFELKCRFCNLNSNYFLTEMSNVFLFWKINFKHFLVFLFNFSRKIIFSENELPIKIPKCF